MTPSPVDIFAEPETVDPDTLKNLGPLAPLAGIWEGSRGSDVHPEREGLQRDDYLERYELQPIDPQTNGPQLLYGLRYHTHITRRNSPSTFHDQVGYWFWEPATDTVIQTLTIPRGLTAMASGKATADARMFELRADCGSPHFGICSNPFLDDAFKTLAYCIEVTIHNDGTWTYQQDTVLKIRDNDELFHHLDSNTLVKVAEASPNPLMTARG
ncbi:MAG: heme-binding beta-barrel domain-containing protein [Methylotetracoccus sp.]|jgi:hypothetical protein|nr:heme-binding beta-barrel domain-containing protein [Methylotetracoccus sp.]